MLEWQYVLQTQDAVGEQHRHQAEEQHGDRIVLPVLLLVRIDAR